MEEGQKRRALRGGGNVDQGQVRKQMTRGERVWGQCRNARYEGRGG